MYTARIELPAKLTQSDVEKLSGALTDVSDSGSALRKGNNERNPWLLSWIIKEKISEEDLTARLALKTKLEDLPDLQISNDDWHIEKIPDTDWLTHSYKQFPPFSIGRFFIYGAHYKNDVPQDQIGLQIDAATAFGSGEHETTQGCLQAMLELKEMGVCPWNILDMGTGSGILAIAAWKLWKTPILAVDNDAEAVRVADRHREQNGLPAGESDMICKKADGFKARAVQKKKPFELIIANILAGTLIEMAGDAKEICDENGYILLSGILNEQADDVLSAYEGLGFILKKRYNIGDWSTLALHNPA